MKYYECKNFEFLIRTRNRKYQEKGSMTFAFNDLPGVNLSHCYISAPRDEIFFNLDIYPNLSAHTRSVIEMLPPEERRSLSRLLKKHSGWSLEKFGLGLYGSEQVHFFAQPAMINRIAEYFIEQEKVLGDLAFTGDWNKTETRVTKLIGDPSNEFVSTQIELIEALDAANDWRDVVGESDRLCVWLWLNKFTCPHIRAGDANLYALKIIERLKWVCFYQLLKIRPHGLYRKDDLTQKYLSMRKEICSAFENLYPFLTWEFPVEPKSL